MKACFSCHKLHFVKWIAWINAWWVQLFELQPSIACIRKQPSCIHTIHKPSSGNHLLSFFQIACAQHVHRMADSHTSVSNNQRESRKANEVRCRSASIPFKRQPPELVELKGDDQLGVSTSSNFLIPSRPLFKRHYYTVAAHAMSARTPNHYRAPKTAELSILG